MVDVVIVGPNDKMPNEESDFIQVVGRFESEPPRQAVIDIDLFVSATGEQQSLSAACAFDDPDDMLGALTQAMRIAEEKNIATIYIADLTSPGRD